MSKYQIAFFTADWNYELVESTLRGLKRFVDEHEDVSLRIFDCFGRDEDSAKERSEYAIFDLAHLNRFDGALIQGNQIVLKSVRDALSQRLVRLGIPTVSIDCPIEGCALLNVDNELAQYEIVSHAIRVHGARRLVYLTGILENGCPEGKQRLNGFKSACRDNGIPAEDCEIIECTWRTTDGAEVARRWLEADRPLPDAFVCGNDEMALGLMECLEDHGIGIPGDVIVTGFDNVSSAELSSPRLSTVHRHYSQMMYDAMTILIGRIEGADARDVIPFEHRLICSESCGCAGSAMPAAIRDKYFRQTRFLKDFYMRQDQMAGEMLEADNLLELMNIVEANRSIFGCDKVYFCINDYYFDNYDKKLWKHSSETFGDRMILAACARDADDGDASKRFCRFPTSDLLPEEVIQRERFLVFYPLHYNTYSIGYIAMNGISEAAKLNLHKSIFNFVEIAVENVRKKELLRQLNSELGNLYVRDALTQLYNRFGLERHGRKAFEVFKAQDGGAQILFIDMDDMKGINDRFGHEMGDLAIRTAADLIRAACDDDAFAMRYGGDEFLVIAPGRATGIEAAIQRGAEACRSSGRTPFRLSLSVGVIRAGRDDPRTLDDCVLAADALMYEMKKRRRTG